MYVDQGDADENDPDDEISSSGEFISVLDPLMLSKINHPARGVFCTHNTCFDAKEFFRFEANSMRWKCPVCQINLRGIQVSWKILRK